MITSACIRVFEEIADKSINENTEIIIKPAPLPSPTSICPTARRARSRHGGDGRHAGERLYADGGEQDALLNAFTIDPATHSKSNGTGTVGWHYSIADSLLDFLGDNDQVALTYTVQVDDHNGGLTSQNVVITVHRAEDAPTVTSSTQSGTVTEDADLSANENAENHSQSDASDVRRR